MNKDIPGVNENSHALRDEKHRIISEPAIADDHCRSNGTDDPKANGQNRFIFLFGINPLIEISEVKKQLANCTDCYYWICEIAVAKNISELLVLDDNPGERDNRHDPKENPCKPRDNIPEIFQLKISDVDEI